MVTFQGTGPRCGGPTQPMPLSNVGITLKPVFVGSV